MSSFSMLLMSAFYIFNPSQGKYLSIDADGKASLSANPTPIEFTQTDDATGRFADDKAQLTWIIKGITDPSSTSSSTASSAHPKQQYTIGYNLADAYATGFLYAQDGISITYAEPDASFQDGIWQILTEEDIQEEEVTLNEENSYTDPQLDKTYTKVSFIRKFAKKAWNSLCVPFPITQEQLEQQFGEGTKVAVYKDFDGTRKVLHFETTDAVEAGKPCLLYPTAIHEDKTYTFKGIASSSWDTSSTPAAITKDGQPSYCGTYSNLGTAPMSSYIFGGDNKMYYVDTNNVPMKGFRAYFLYQNGSAAKQLTWGFGDTPTDIEVIPGTESASPTPRDIYQMDGKLVKRKATTTEGLRPGVYIMNGMKVIVKQN